MAVARSSSRPRYYLLLVVLTAVTLIVISGNGDKAISGPLRSGARDVFGPLSDAANATVQPIANVFSALFHYGDLKDQNAKLRDQLEELQAAKLQNDQLRRNLSELGALENLTFLHDVPAVTARVTSDATSNFEASIEIGKGSADGIAKGMPVVAGGGLVGRIAEVSRNRSVVALITDSSQAVAVRVPRANDIGIASGKGMNRDLQVDMIRPDADVRVGDPVLTSGLQDSVYPADIPIGKVTKAPKAKAGELQRTLRVHPAVDSSRLVFVRVLQWAPNNQ